MFERPKQDWRGYNSRRERVVQNEVREAGAHSRAFGIYTKCNRNHLGFILSVRGRKVMIRSDILVHLMQIILGAACKMESTSYGRELGIPLEMIMVVACIRVIVPSGIFTHADNLM